MSEHNLPEDIEFWPRDPCALLGVSDATGRRELRRAYARLIRVYKPEHFPIHFRRLRDAYELLDQRAAWMEGVNAAASEANEAALFADAVVASEPETKIEPLDDAPAMPQPEPVRFPGLDRNGLWREARRGNLAAAYSAYAQSAQLGQADEELFARLFWMLRIDRSLDPTRDPSDWLVAGMKLCGLRGRLPGLYGNELREVPQEISHRRCDEALRCSGHNGQLCELILARWEAAAGLEQWEVIAGDLEAMRARLHEDSAVWGRLLLAAIEHYTWAQLPTAFEILVDWRREIEQLAEHYPPLAGELDQRDGLADLVQACDHLNDVTNIPVEWRKALCKLLMTSWNRTLDAFRTELLEVLLPLVQNPIVGLECLDRLETRAKPALHRLSVLIAMLANECGVGRQAPPAEELLERFARFVVAASKKTYPARWGKWIAAAPQSLPFGRRELLMFCLQESVSPRQLLDYFARSLRQDLAQFLAPAGNASLHFLCLAYFAFWA